MSLNQLPQGSELNPQEFRVLSEFNKLRSLSDYEPPPDAKPLFTPPGIPRAIFLRALDVAALIHNLNNGINEDYLDPKALKSHMPNVPLSTLTKLVATKSFYDGLLLRGIINGQTTQSLSGEQIRALAILTDMTSFGSFERKLKSAGIPAHKFNVWMNNQTFRALHDRLVHQAFLSSTKQIDAQIARGALEGKLDFIKYYKEVSNPPAQRAHADVQTLLDGIADILMRNITDSEMLKRISAELSTIVAKLG